jgi:thiol:disulfide interchange protein DsbD
MLWTLLGIFIGGVALNLTPCVYPLIPITVSYFGGKAARGGQEKRGDLVTHGLCYVGGLAATNSTLGVVAALSGGLMGAWLQNPMVLLALAGILVLFATSLFGLWELKLPTRLAQVASRSYAAPCIGPFVLGLLTWVASMMSPWLGFLIFFTLGLGLGLPLFLLAMFSGQLQRLPRSGGWMLWVRKLLGWVLVGMAAHFLRPLLPQPWDTALIAGLALVAGVHLGWLDKSQANFRFFSWLKTGAALTGLIIATTLLTSWAMRGPGVAWQPYSEKILAEARKAGMPVVMDFHAGWCTPCRELEEVTLHDPMVVREAARFVMIKVDLTKGGNPIYEELVRKHAIKGVPTVLFLDPDGKERADLRLVDYLPPDQFVNRMIALKKRET